MLAIWSCPPFTGPLHFFTWSVHLAVDDKVYCCATHKKVVRREGRIARHECLSADFVSFLIFLIMCLGICVIISWHRVRLPVPLRCASHRLRSIACLLLVTTAAVAHNINVSVNPHNVPPHVADSQHVLTLTSASLDGFRNASSTATYSLSLGLTPCETTLWHSSSSIACRTQTRCDILGTCFSQVIGRAGVLGIRKHGTSSEVLSGYDSDISLVHVDGPVLDSVGVNTRWDDEAGWSASLLDQWGTCGSFAPGGINHGWCLWDSACNYCRQVSLVVSLWCLCACNYCRQVSLVLSLWCL